jgi:predicted Holliday junction resolvase-like endonuclease
LWDFIIETVPIQTVVAICTALLTIIGGLILAFLAKMFQEIKELKNDISKKKKTMKAELEKKANIDLVSSRLDSIDATLRQMEPKLNQVAEDVAFIKGKEEARRELATKS